MAKNFTDSFGSIELAKTNTDLAKVAKNLVGADPFWDVAKIDEQRWDESFPFQLLVLKDEGKGGAPQRVGTFTLPIPPQALNISMPFSIGVSPTQGGIHEEHNGAVFRNITLQGTTGVNPGRVAGPMLGAANAVQSIFAGTIRSVQNTAARLDTLQGTQKPAIVTYADIEGPLKGSTGYYQFLLLSQFLESYVRIKKTAAGKKHRLAFAHWKQQAVYLVTPVLFDARQDTQSPLETVYTLQLRAWKRISLEQGQLAVNSNTPVARDPGALQSVQKSLNDARSILSSVKDVIAATGQDVSNLLFEPLRSVILFCKDAIGVPISLADLPVSIVRDMKATILEAAGVGRAVNETGAAFQGVGPTISDEIRDMGDQITQMSVSSGKSETQGGEQVGRRRDELGSGNPDPANKILEDPAAYFELFDQIKPSNLNLPPATTRKIVEERERVRLLNRLDFEAFRDDLVTLMNDFSDACGAGSASYNQIHNRPAPTSTKTPTSDDWDAIFALNASILEMNRLAASGSIDDKNRLTAIEYVAGLAGRSGMTFEIPRSKLQIPFPYGSTLEMVASRYLGDPDRWIEIATLNRLRSPYVDEVGFDLLLRTNGNGNTVVVGDSSDLFVGQPVWVSANTVRRQKRRITNIDVIDAETSMLTLDGDPDLDDYTVQGGASLHAFLPDTVNSQMLLFVPSDRDPNEEDFEGKSIPGLDQFDQMLRIGGVDLLLTQDGDCAITEDGDWKLAVGKANLVQKVRTFTATPRGSLMRHKNYGIGIKPGTMTADVSAREMLVGLKDLLTFDPVFTGVRSASVLKQGPLTKIAASLEISGTNELLPVTLDVVN